jgi:hypothetical protein
VRAQEFERVCYWTEQREVHLPLVNMETGEVGYSFGCTYEGETVRVRLDNGELDSWNRKYCREA